MTKEKKNQKSKNINPEENYEAKIKNLEIKNFRGIEYLKIDKLSKINIFVGRNGIGKTSVLEALALLFSGRRDSRFPGRFRRRWVDNFPHNIIDNLRKSNGNGEGKDIFTFFYLQNFENIPTIISGNEKLELFLDINKLKDEREEHGGFKLSLKYYKNGKEDLEENKKFCYLVNNNDNELELKLIDNILSDGKEKKKDLIDTLKSINKHVTSFDVISNDLYIHHDEMTKPIPIKFLGDGINKILNFYSSIYFQKDQYAVIDEIENGLHYRSQELVWKIIAEQSAINNVDLFITTHSYEMLESLVKFLEKEENEKYRKLFGLHTLFKNPNKEDKLDITTYKNYNEILDDINDKFEVRGLN